MNSPKVQRLSLKCFKGWINLLCIAKEKDGILPDVSDIAFRLRISKTEANELLQVLTRSGLLDRDGDTLTPHNWDKRQYKSDVSTDRVKRFRNAERNVSETPNETFQKRPQSRLRADSEQSRAETDSEQSDAGESRFSFEQRKAYVKAVKDKKQVYSISGLARYLGNGDEDDQIAEWVETQELRAKLKAQGIVTDPEDYSMDDWITGCIERDDRAHLEMERKLIEERGGPKELWEHRVFQFFVDTAGPARRGPAG